METLSKKDDLDAFSRIMGIDPSPAHSFRDIVDVERADDEGHVTHYELHVRRAAVIGDPVHPKTWAEQKLRLIFIYWLSMLLVASILVACTIFAFHLVPSLYSTEKLFDIFLAPPYYIKSIVGVSIAIILSSFYALFILMYPDSTKWRIGNLRWFVVIFLNGYILWCLAHDIKHISSLSKDIKNAMKNDFRPGRINLTHTLIRDQTQAYFRCCGLTSYKDWHTLPTINKTGYPHSCCDDEVYPICAEPLFHTIKVPKVQEDEEEIKYEDKVAIHENGCIEHEVAFARSVGCFFITLAGLFVLSSIGVAIFTNMILAYLPPDLQVEQANPFFD